MKSGSSREEIKKIAENTIEPCDCGREIIGVRKIRENNNYNYMYLLGILYIFLFVAIMISGR